MINNSFLRSVAMRIPVQVRKTILQEQLIEKAVNVEIINTPMHFLFDVYAQYLDPTGSVSTWTCSKCRAKVLVDFRSLLPIINDIENETITNGDQHANI